VSHHDGAPLLVPIPIGDREILVQVWRVQVGRVPLYLLDADRPENDVVDRWITARLYVGDRATRLEQYALLGVGGIRVLDAMGIEPSVIHLNEGHAAFAPLERARRSHTEGTPQDEALAAARSRTVFTTHTPVPAGNETYREEEVLRVLGRPFAGWEGVVATNGATTTPGEIGMTSLGLRSSRTSSGVSRLHGEVSRRMWQPLFPGIAVEDVPITHVTNGVHVPTWMGSPMRELLDGYLGPGWMQRADDPATWEAVDTIADRELWEVRCRMRARLTEYVHARDVESRLSRYESRESVEAATGAFDPDRLTLGFARRVATYKRLPLLWSDPGRAAALLGKPDTVQLILAGKAHPRDRDAKARLAEFFRLPWHPEVGARMTFLEDYEMGMAAELVWGCDVWVNIPRPPMEASGTSGMKSALNGGLNLSVLDGWWAEAYDGANGWAIGDPLNDDPPQVRDAKDAEALYDAIEQDLLPLFHERDADGVPHGWTARIKASLRTIGPRFCAGRMVREYTDRIYPPA
jgi:glycogen phosphorylase